MISHGRLTYTLIYKHNIKSDIGYFYFNKAKKYIFLR